MKIGLALGGGSARGYAHVGIIKALERHSIHPDYVAGCSMGALIGALYASGIHINRLEELAINVTPKQWMDLTISRKGIMSGKKLESIITTLTGGQNIEDMPIPFAAIAADVVSYKPYIFTKGPVSTAVRASTAIPAVFEPVYLNDKILVDGGFVDIVPADMLTEMGAGYTIAVDVGFSSVTYRPTNMVDILLLSIDTLQKQLKQLKKIKADVIIRPDLSGIRPNQFDRAKDCIEIGEDAAEKILSQGEIALRQ